MKIYGFLLSLLLLLPVAARAQQDANAPDTNAPAEAPAAGDAKEAVSGPRILQIEAKSAASVLSLAQRKDVDAVSLNLSSGDLQAQPGSREAIRAWVRGGGIVLLHTDLARWFGYSTVPARAPTPQVAGQLFGRAEAALPLGGHPLLWDGPAAGRRAPTEEPGVHLVYYELREGDHLVTEHPAAVPLLRVTDLAVADDMPLYAAAIAPYGQGWAVFTPYFIEQDRADGALFAQNLTQWIAGVNATRRAPTASDTAANNTASSATSVAQWYSLPATFLEAASDAASRNAGRLDAAATLQEMYKTFQAAPSTPAVLPATEAPAPNAETPEAEEAAPTDAPRLLLRREELTALAALLSGASTPAAAADAAGPDAPPNQAQTARATPAQARVAALLYLLRARLELQRNQTTAAAGWVQAAAAIAPDSAEVLLWKGVLTAGPAANLALASPDRAALLAQSMQLWNAALTAPALAGAPAQQSGLIGSVPVALVQAWLASSQQRGQLLNVEPPLVALLGTAANPVVVRHFPDDATLRLALPAGDLLPRASEAMGWRASEEEILIFPTLEYYQAYRAAAGLGQPAIADATGAGGDVVGHRILMISQPALPVILPSGTPGAPPRVVQFGTAVPVIISRLHAYVLMHQLVRDGNPPPAWLQVGLVTLANLTVTTDVGLNGVDMEMLRRNAQAGGLLTPEQFRAVLARPTPGGTAEAEAARLLAFFYARFGPGGVVETLQRLGAGETTDEALTAVTGMNEEQFFLAWRNADFGL
jgi:hypothetical protein